MGKCDFAAHTPEWYLFHYRPWIWPPQVVHIGVNAMCSHWEAITPANFEGDNLAVLAATRFHDGLGQWWVDSVISKISMGWGTSSRWPERRRLGQAALVRSATCRRSSPQCCRRRGSSRRTATWSCGPDWTPDATYALFRCGRYGEIDGYWGRNQCR